MGTTRARGSLRRGRRCVSRSPGARQNQTLTSGSGPFAELADSMVRCLPEDGTNGFFVACFVKDTTAAPIEAPNMPERAPQPEPVAAAAAEDAADVEASVFEDEVLGEAATGAVTEQDVVLPAKSAESGKKGGKKAKSTVTQATRNAKEELLGSAAGGVSAEKGPVPDGKGGKKLSKKQQYLLKKEELKRKKAEAAGVDVDAGAADAE